MPDLEATLEMVKESPKFKEEDAGKTRRMLEQMLPSMRLNIGEEQIQVKFGSRQEETTPYTVKSESDKEMDLTLHTPNKEVSVTLQLIAEKRIRLLVDGSDDMDFFVWKPADSMQADDPNMAELVAGVMQDDSAAKRSSDASDKPIESIDQRIQNNLRQIASAADQYFIEHGVTEVRFDQLEGDYFKKLEPANGETYSDLVIRHESETISVTDNEGNTHTYKLRR